MAYTSTVVEEEISVLEESICMEHILTTGFKLDAIHANGCCVPRYMFELLNNKLETNPRKKIAKNVIDDLGMLKEDGGCCIAQVADFCKNVKAKFYALDYKHKLFETSKDEIPNNNLPRLAFMRANNHMYLVIDEERRETTFKTSSKINKYRAQQKPEHKIKHGT